MLTERSGEGVQPCCPSLAPLGPTGPPGCQHLPKRPKPRSLKSKQLVTLSEASGLAAALLRVKQLSPLPPPLASLTR